MSAVSELNDNCFNITIEFLVEVSEAYKDELGQLPTLEDLSEILAWSMRTCSAEVVRDVDVGRVKKITFDLLPKGIGKVTPGDIVAVPAGRGKHYFGVFITKNRIGHAFGFFRGLWPARPLKEGTKLEPCGRPLYVGKHALVGWGWRRVGHDPSLLEFFDSDPEIYHSKSDHRDNPAIGEFGAAERPTGRRLRQIDRDEAERVGLLDGSYRRGPFYEDDLGHLLRKWNCEDDDSAKQK